VKHSLLSKEHEIADYGRLLRFRQSPTATMAIEQERFYPWQM